MTRSLEYLNNQKRRSRVSDLFLALLGSGLGPGLGMGFVVFVRRDRVERIYF